MKIITPVVNNPTFIEIQYNTLKKYMQCDYEFIVFNDAKDFQDFTNGYDSTMSSKIQELCNRLNIRCIRIDNQHHRICADAALRCADSYNFILEFQKRNPDKYLSIDSDMFLVDFFNPEEYFKDFISGVVKQTRHSGNERIDYIWNGIFYFDFNSMTDTNLLDWRLNRGTDVGGKMDAWLSKQNTEEIHYIRQLCSCDWKIENLPDNLKDNELLIDFLIKDPRNENGKIFCEIYDNKFLHYRAGGNWRNEGLNFHQDLSNKLMNIF